MTAIIDLATELENMPLALTQAAAYFETDGRQVLGTKIYRKTAEESQIEEGRSR